MRFQLGPRDEKAAARTAAWIFLVSAIVVTVSNLLTPMPASAQVRLITLILPLLVFGGLLAWPSFAHKSVLLLVSPLLGVFLAVVLNLLTQDASAGAQVAFCLPVLFAASQLRVLGAGLSALAAVVGDALVVAQLRPNAAGVLDLVNVSLVVVLMTGLLAQAGRRQDRLVAQLESRAALDPLTGLVTRRVLDEAVHRSLDPPGCPGGTALILVDVDHFKSINDGYGHPVGDDALVHVAKVLRRHSRPSTVISRLGGDEIAVLLPGCAEVVARDRAHRFLEALMLSPLILPDGRNLTISISIGVAHAQEGEPRLRELYAAADASLYEAKRSGRGRVGRAAQRHPVPTAGPEPDSEGLAYGLLEMRNMPAGVIPGKIGLTSDDCLDHR